MKTLILNSFEACRLIKRRRALGIDGPDEVWDGTYIVFPPHDNEHQRLRTDFACAFHDAIPERPGLFIALAAGTGVVAARLTKALVAEEKDDATTGTTTPSTSTTGSASTTG